MSVTLYIYENDSLSLSQIILYNDSLKLLLYDSVIHFKLNVSVLQKNSSSS